MSLLEIRERRLQGSNNRYKEPARPDSEPRYRLWTTESYEVDSLTVCLGLGFYGVCLQAIWVWGLNGISSRGISEHAIAPDFDIKQMFFLVSPRIGNEPRNTFPSTSQALDGFGVFRIKQTFAIGIKVELKALLFQHARGDFNVDLEPVG